MQFVRLQVRLLESIPGLRDQSSNPSGGNDPNAEPTSAVHGSREAFSQSMLARLSGLSGNFIEGFDEHTWACPGLRRFKYNTTPEIEGEISPRIKYSSHDLSTARQRRRTGTVCPCRRDEERRQDLAGIHRLQGGDHHAGDGNDGAGRTGIGAPYPETPGWQQHATVDQSEARSPCHTRPGILQI